MFLIFKTQNFLLGQWSQHSEYCWILAMFSSRTRFVHSVEVCLDSCKSEHTSYTCITVIYPPYLLVSAVCCFWQRVFRSSHHLRHFAGLKSFLSIPFQAEQVPPIPPSHSPVRLRHSFHQPHWACIDLQLHADFRQQFRSDACCFLAVLPF